MAATLVAALGTAAAGMAQAATTETFNLNVDGCSSACIPAGVTSLGTVTVDATGGDLDFTVQLADLPSAKGGQVLFNANGNNQHYALVFDLDVTGAKISNYSSGFGAPTEKGKKGNTVLDSGPYSNSAFGKAWNYAVAYTGTAQQGSTPSELTFTVSDPGRPLALRDLKAGFTSSTTGAIYAAADIYDVKTQTGNIGATLTPFTPPAVPEPATWTILIVGVGMLGGALRRGGRIDSAAA